MFSSQLFDPCPVCGYKTEELELTGKCKCQYCYEQFFENSKAAYKFSYNKQNLSIPPKYLLLEKQELEERIFQKANISVRYRIARNIDGFLLGRHSENNEILLTTIRNLFVDWDLSSIQPNLVQKNGKYHLHFFDEDHIRIEFFPNHLTELEFSIQEKEFWNNTRYFAFAKKLGFLNSCPTNLGRGNKLSIRFMGIPAKNLELFRAMLTKKMLLVSSPISINTPQPITVYIKNANLIRLLLFLRISAFALDSFLLI